MSLPKRGWLLIIGLLVGGGSATVGLVLAKSPPTFIIVALTSVVLAAGLLYLLLSRIAQGAVEQKKNATVAFWMFVLISVYFLGQALYSFGSSLVRGLKAADVAGVVALTFLGLLFILPALKAKRGLPK